MAFELTSSAFADGGEIPIDHTCDGADQPIPLAWSGAPEGAAELALLMDDPDAQNFVHWVVVDIPAEATELAPGALPAGAREGRNDFGRSGYGGPCPPSGSHRYRFVLYALGQPLASGGTLDGEGLRRAVAGSVLGEARLEASYRRQR